MWLLFEGLKDLPAVPRNSLDTFKNVIAVVGGVGSVLAVSRTVSDLLLNRKLQVKKTNELKAAAELAKLQAQFPDANAPDPNHQALARTIKTSLEEKVRTIGELDRHLDELAKDPVLHLSLPARIFLWFRPAGIRGWIAHSLTYSLLICSVWFLWRLGYNAEKHYFEPTNFAAAWYADDGFQYETAVEMAMLLFGVIIFRAWAIGERRHACCYQRRKGPLAMALLLIVAESGRMLIAQLCFFVGLLATIFAFGVVLFSSDSSANPDLPYSLQFLFAAAFTLIPTIIFQRWAVAELDFVENRPALLRKRQVMGRMFGRNGHHLLIRVLPPLLLAADVWMFIRSSSSLGLEIIAIFLMPALLVPFYGCWRILRIRCSSEAAPAPLAAMTATAS